MNAFKIEVYDMGLGRGPLEKSAVRVVVCKQEQKQWKMRKKICQKKSLNASSFGSIFECLPKSSGQYPEGVN